MADRNKTKRVEEEELSSGGGSAYARLKRHRVEMGSGRVCIAETWRVEESLLECSPGRIAFERFVPEGLGQASKAMVDDARRLGLPTGRVRNWVRPELVTGSTAGWSSFNDSKKFTPADSAMMESWSPFNQRIVSRVHNRGVSVRSPYGSGLDPLLKPWVTSHRLDQRIKSYLTCTYIAQFRIIAVK